VRQRRAIPSPTNRAAPSTSFLETPTQLPCLPVVGSRPPNEVIRPLTPTARSEVRRFHNHILRSKPLHSQVKLWSL
jgi:hypothetical protein